MRVVLLRRTADGKVGRDESLGSMKQKYEGKDLQGLVDLGREQGYLTFDQVNGFLPQDVASPTDLRAALESFEDMDIKVLEEVPTEGAEGEIDAEPEKEAEEETADAAGDSFDPVRLYLKEMGNFQLLSREQEVEIAKRIEAGEQEVEEEVLKSPVTLDFVIGLGDRIEAGEADLRDIFEESEELADPDEERGPEANEKLLKKLHDSTKKLKDFRAKLEEAEEELRERPGPRRKPKLERNYARMRERVKAAFTTMGLSRHVREAVIAEMRHQLEQFHHAHQIVQHYEESSLGDFVEDKLAPSPVEAAIQGNLGEQTRKVLATLTPREEQILRMRFGIGQKADCTLEVVGKQFAVTRERIRQIEAKALRKLRQTGRSRNLEGFMERE